jgi:hypothetical protein
MATATLRRSFITFHLTLGMVLLFFSVRTAIAALGPAAGHANPHVGALAIGEAIGALLFLLPRTLRAGATLLLATIGIALLVHLAAGQFRGDLLVYAVGTWFVMIHGSGWANRGAPVDLAA